MVSKPLLLVLLVSISFNLLFGYLSYEFYGDKKKAEISLGVALAANEKQAEKIEKDKKASDIKEETLVEAEKKQDELEDKFSVLEQKLKSKKCPIPTKGAFNEADSNLADELSSIKLLLDEAACLANGNSACNAQ